MLSPGAWCDSIRPKKQGGTAVTHEQPTPCESDHHILGQESKQNIREMMGERRIVACPTSKLILKTGRTE